VGDITKAQYFTPKWFAALFRAKYSLGDTFWAGAIGAQLLFAPFWFVIVMFVVVLAPAMMNAFIIVVSSFYTLYYLMLSPVVIVTAMRDRTSGGWRWVAVVFSLVFLATALWLLFSKL